MRSLTCFRVLGALEVTVGDGRVPIRSTKQRILLASLLLKANRLLTLDELIDRLWVEPPSDARGTAQAHLGRLRRTLAGAGAERLIRTDPQGYVIEVTDEQFDLARFAGLTGRARRESEGRREVALLREALGLWRGRPLGNVPSDHVQRYDVPRLVEHWLQAAERRFELELELGDGGGIIGELQELANAEPFRERLWALLMTALYRQGRQQEALECYSACATILREEIGLDPGQELRDLHQAILRRSLDLPGPRPHRDASVPAPRWETRLGSPCQLPAEIGDFVGRAAQLEQIVEHFVVHRGSAAVPIVAVVGCPGSGKTALAVKAAHVLRDLFPGGQLYVQLGSTTQQPRDLRDALGDLLSGLGERGVRPGDLEGSTTLLRERLADRQVLLVVDDVADAGQARAVLPGTPGCGVLLTGRRRLMDLPGVERVGLGSLTPAEALVFLERLIGAARVQRERSKAEELARLCGHLPLALRIAGSRLALWPSRSLAPLAEALRDETRRLDELETQDLRLRAVLDTGYAALDPTAQALLRRLGALPGTEFTESTALALAGRDGVRALDRLVEAGLVEPDTGGGSRYHLCSLVGLHARQQPAAGRAS